MLWSLIQGHRVSVGLESSSELMGPYRRVSWQGMGHLVLSQVPYSSIFERFVNDTSPVVARSDIRYLLCSCATECITFDLTWHTPAFLTLPQQRVRYCKHVLPQRTILLCFMHIFHIISILKRTCYLTSSFIWENVCFLFECSCWSDEIYLYFNLLFFAH